MKLTHIEIRKTRSHDRVYLFTDIPLDVKMLADNHTGHLVLDFGMESETAEPWVRANFKADIPLTIRERS